MIRTEKNLACAFVVAALTLAGAPARADDAGEPPPRNHRTFGWGIGAGGGVQTFFRRTTPLGAPLYPAIELQIFPFRHRDWAIDLSFPLWNTILTSVNDHALFLQLDGFFDFNVGENNVRFLVGPGLGADVRHDLNLSGGVRFPFEVGAEVLVMKKHLGLRFLARPWTEIVFDDRGGGSTMGILGVFVLTAYTTRISLEDEP